MYKENLLDHFKNPRNQGKLVESTFIVEENNPLCGDLVKIYGVVDGDILKAASFMGRGCVISQAVASMLLEKYIGFTVAELLSLSSKDILELIQMPLGPNRLKCALLSLIALQKGLKGSAGSF